MKLRELKSYVNKFDESMLHMDVEVSGDSIRLTDVNEVQVKLGPALPVARVGSPMVT